MTDVFSDDQVMGGQAQSPQVFSDSDVMIPSKPDSTQPAAGQKENVSIPEDVGKSAASGLGKTASYLMNPMGLVRDTGNTIIGGATRMAGAAYEGMGGELSPGAAEYLTYPLGNPDKDLMTLAQRGVQKAIGADYVPKTPYGRAAQAATESLPFVANGEGAATALTRAAGIGVGSATGNEAAKGFGFGEKGQQVGSVLGGALGATAPEGLRGAGENAAVTAQEEPPPPPGGGQPPQPYKAPVFDPDAALQSISKEYGDQMENAGKYYDFMRTMAQGKGAKFGEGAKDALDGVISDVEADPFHEGRPTLTSLKKMSAKMGDGDLDLNDAVDLKQFLNTKFNPSRFLESKDSPYAQLGNATDKVLQDAAKTYPDFGDAKTIADRNWVNNVSMPFRNNDVLQKFWKPDDYYAHQSLETGMADYLPDETNQRADQLVSNIKTPAQLDAVTRVLPGDQAALLRQTKLQELQAAGGRLTSAGKALYHAVKLQAPSALRAAADAINPEYTPQQQALMDAAKQTSPRLTAKYADQFDELQQMAMNPRFSMIDQTKALPAPNQPLALPAPQRPMVSENGVARPMTDAELESSNARSALLQAPEGNEFTSSPTQRNTNLAQAAQDSKRANAQSLGIEPGNYKAIQERQNPTTELGQLQQFRESQSAWDKAERNLLDQGYTHKQALNTLGKRPSSFKAGGAVNAAPTEAQKEAGNYRKDHIVLHGFHITIENPKGSIRSGKDGNGKEWKVRMPADYGYFRRTEGADGDHVDCYIGPNPDSKRVWILDQKDAETNRFDEHKVFLGFRSKPQVLAIYRKAFSDGKADKRIHAVTEVTLEQLREWLNEDMKRAA